MITLRKATTQDIPNLLKIEQGVAGTKIYSPMLTEKEWMEELQKSTVYVIEKDGVIVGDISYEKKNNDHAYISGFAVDPRFQHQGIGREALMQILTELKNMKRVDLLVHPENPAIKLYESFGFTYESREENHFGDGEPRVLMVLEKK